MPNSAANRTPASTAQGVQGDGSFEMMVLRVLLLLRDASPRLLKAGGIAKASAAKIVDAVEDDALAMGADAEALLALALGIVRAAGLTVVLEDRLTVNGLAVDKYFSLTPAERLNALRQAWLAADDLNEFHLVHAIEIAGGRQGASPARTGEESCVPGAARMRDIRARVVAALAELPDERWTRSSAFSRITQERAPDLLAPLSKDPRRTVRYYGGIKLKGEADLPVRERDWDRVEGALIDVLLRLPLRALGYVETRDGEGTDIAFRPRRDLPQAQTAPRDERPLVIQSNFEVTALLPEMDAPMLWRLARLASPVSFGQTAIFRLQERHIAQAVNEGHAPDELLTFLESRSRTGLPQNVRYSVEEWVRRARRMTIYLDACLFEAEGTENASALVREAWSKRAVLTPLGDKHLAGSMQACPNPAEAAAPRYPLYDYSRSLPPVVTAAPDGMLSCPPETAHFRALRVASRMGEQVSIERWRLTRESFGGAVAGGLPYERALELLGSVVKGELPPLLRVRLAAWAGKAGSVSMQQVTLLEFQRPEIAELLRADKRTAKLFVNMLGTRICALSPEDAAAVQALLRELSLDVEADDDV